MEFKDYYTVMGLARDASQAEIKRAYRKLARKFHPDVSQEEGAEAKFKEVGEAYAVLRDAEKRASYDELGAGWKDGQEFDPPPDWGSGFEFDGRGFSERGTAGDYSEFFSSLFGQGFGPAAGHRSRAGVQTHGDDHHAKVFIDINDAYSGATRNVTLRRPELDGNGRLINIERKLKVTIPKGVKTGQRIRLSGQGEPGLGGGAAGDLYLEIEFNVHNIYRAEGKDVYLDLPVAPWEAALGTSVKVPTPAGPVNLNIPAGTNYGRKLRLKGRGIPGDPPGDLYAVVQVTVPAASSDAAKELYRKMGREMAYNPREKLGV